MDSKWIAPIAGTVLGALGAFEPNINQLIAAHPNYAALFYMISMIAASMAKQPQK